MNHHNEFKLLSETSAPNTNQNLLEFQHKKTGARHIHIQSDDQENTFMVVLKTMPKDETGVAHILEHITLCGSEKYPVRDPFFMMLRRSLNTYMNASTANDHTSYYFSSQNKKDYFNLMQVYCDAVFFPLLHPLDFAQEGHRQALNDGGQLEYRGVVYNEMKGAMSDFTSQLWQRLNTLLYPDTTYRYNSGGEPMVIPELDYEAMKAFHKEFYHPSNAIFCTAGNMDVLDLQTNINDWVLTKYQSSQPVAVVDLQKNLSHKQIRKESFAVNDQSGPSSQHLRAWLLGQSTDIDEWLMAKVMSYLLAGDSAAPMMHFLETTDLGACPSSLTGLHAYFQQMSFVIGVEQANPDTQNDWITTVDEILMNIKQNGFESERIEAVFDQFELQLKDRSASTPYGIQLLSRCVLPALHQAPVKEFLFLDEALRRCRHKLNDPKAIASWIDQWLINNQHQVILTAIPDESLIEQQKNMTEKDLNQTLAQLDQDALVSLKENESKLEERQRSPQDLNVLPSLSKKDLEQPSNIMTVDNVIDASCRVDCFEGNTQGITYANVMIGLPKLSEADWPIVTILADCLGSTGAAGCDYISYEKKQTRYTGGVYIDLWLNQIQGDIQAFLQIETKCLHRHFEPASKILQDIWTSSDFNDQKRIRDLVAQLASDSLESIAYHGHRLAMSAAWAQVDTLGALKNKIAGLPQCAYLSQLAKEIKEPKALDTFCQALNQSYQSMITSDLECKGLLVSDSLTSDQANTFAQLWVSNTSVVNQETAAIVTKPMVWLCDVQVNYCAMSFVTVDIKHEHAPALAVLSQILTNGYLHRVIREQGGAYGGGAVYKPLSGEFSFYSYRDPNDIKTLDAFKNAIGWVLDGSWPEYLFEEAIISLIGQLDKPDTPIGGPKRVFMNACAGFDEQDRINYRDRLMSLEIDMVKVVANMYLQAPNKIGQVIIAPKQNSSRFNDEDFSILRMD